jgi:formylglycine-generating enzyme required for sulfatase activity/serine/threonine protein kinase
VKHSDPSHDPKGPNPNSEPSGQHDPITDSDELQATRDETSGHPEDDPRATIDDDATIAPADFDPDATIDTAEPRRMDETIEKTADPSASRTLYDHEAQTAETVPGEADHVWARMANMWSGAITADSKPGHTLKVPPAKQIRTATVTITAKPKRVTEAGTEPDPAADYEFLELLGEGGMGVVYEARQTSIDRRIAIKMIKPHEARHSSQCAKFVTEAVVTGDLEHPNIVPVYDLGTNDAGQPFYAMKRVHGTPWCDVIAELGVEENLRILMHVADAVAFAHSKGVVHRDLKPANVMLGEFGEVLVMDWGVAAAASTASKAATLTDRSAMCGTPAYMSPEMALGTIDRIGPASDIYLLGGILYEIITGLQPHTGKTVMQCLMAAANNEIQPCELGGELIEIARCAMDAEPARRYPSVKAFQAAVADYQSHAQSFMISQRADERLEQAEHTGNYDDYVQALFGYRQALELWPGNRGAQEGETEAALRYARRALDRQDLDLADSLLDRDQPAHRQLGERIDAARTEQAARRRRYTLYRRGAQGLAAAVIVILTVASVWINAEKRRALDAQAQAVAEREKAVLAQQAEAEQRLVAELATAKAREEEARARQALADMIEARSKEQQARARAKAAEVMATEAQDELARSGMLLDNTWWTFKIDRARELQQQARVQTGHPIDLRIVLPERTPLEMKLIPAGSFVMGSPAQEEQRGGEEYLHRAVITHPFYLARHELTQAQWRAITGQPHHSAQQDPPPADNTPVVDVSWRQLQHDLLPAAQDYAPEGFVFVLPTEAQWEYACRAGTGTAYHAGDDPQALEQVGWFLANSDRRVQPVGTRDANQWGLHDMHGNVAEWCADLYDPQFYLVAAVEDPINLTSGQRRVIRGGGCINLPEHCRAAYRSWANATNQYRFLGVRLALIPAEHVPDAQPTPTDKQQPDSQVVQVEETSP